MARKFFHISVLLLLTQMFFRVVTQQCNGGGSEESILGWMLQGHVYKTMLADLSHTCVLSCRKDDRCQSFNWIISLSMCEFSNRTEEARPEDFVPNPDRFYFKRDKNRVPLGSIPELPAETCTEIKGSKGGQAVSKKYWFSSIKPGVPVLAYCDMKTEDVDECTASPSVCDVNANCNNTRGSYGCTCKSGFSGDGKTCRVLKCGTIFDFENGLSGWTLTGTAFNNQPTYGDNPTARGRGQPSNHKGDWWIGSVENRPSPSQPAGAIQGDGPQGSITSPSFVIVGNSYTFLIGGGCEKRYARAELIIEGNVVLKETGSCSETMTEKSWDVSAYTGKQAQLRLIDSSSGIWHHINFDHFNETCP